MSRPSRFVTVWSMLQGLVASGWLPGFTAAVRHRGEVEVHSGGCLTRDGTDPVRPDSLFRLASLSKPFAGVLALALVEDGVLGLDDPVGRWLPELAAPRVLARPGGPLTETVPAQRAITVRHLLTATPGFGGLWDGSPLSDAMAERQLEPGAVTAPIDADEFLARLGGLPLAAQPGERWLYHVSTDVLSALLVRATGRPLRELLAERVTGPLGLADTGFWAPDRARLTESYFPGSDGLDVLDPVDGLVTRPPAFESLAAGLVSTAPDVLALLAALADGGGPVLAPASVATMTTDSLTPAQRAQISSFIGPGRSWGMQVGVQVEPGEPWATPGRFGWDGGTGTTGHVDPARDLVAVLLTTRGWDPVDDVATRFWAALHRCL